jgi:predicted kinase
LRFSGIRLELLTVEHRVPESDRTARNGHRGGILWFTGLSGAGKSTLAMELERLLFAKGYQVTALDGDNIRQGLSSDLGFSPQDRAENIRRIGEVAGLFAEAGLVVISEPTATVSARRTPATSTRSTSMRHWKSARRETPRACTAARVLAKSWSSRASPLLMNLPLCRIWRYRLIAGTSTAAFPS